VTNLDDEASELRSLARKPARFLYRRHAEQELQKDGIPKIDVENMLRRCRVTMVEERGGELTRRAEGTDINGRPIVVIVVPDEETGAIKIITGWAAKR
jgi:hypothetical protein